MSIGTGRRHFGIVTQVYPPDPAAVGQHLADVAEELGRLGHQVTVLTSDRGYDDPSQRYPHLERNGNVTILRLPFCSFGKSSIAARLLGGTSLLAQSSVLTLLAPRLDALLLSTIPHLAGGLGVGWSLLRRRPFHYWLMDLNPDQLVATGRVPPNSPVVAAFNALNRSILKQAKSITALDGAMAERFAAKSSNLRRIDIQPPWPAHDDASFSADQAISFRNQHGLTGKRVIMHAGNHSAVHPLDTLIGAIRDQKGSSMHYVFVGGGLGKVPIERWVLADQPRNVLLLPYQPRSELPALLSAADIHVVSVGNDTVGVVHPSKAYGALAAGRPLLVLGPKHSPAARLVSEFGVGWVVEHGNMHQATRVLEIIEGLSDNDLLAMKAQAFELGQSRFSRRSGVETFCSRILQA